MILARISYDVIVITESWLTVKLYEGEFNIDGYKSFFSHRLNYRGGGVIIYVKSNLNPVQIKENFVSTNIEVVACKALDITFICVYRSPTTNVSDSKALWSFLERVCSQKRNPIVLLGDFNLPEINWITLNFPSNLVDFQRMINACNFKQNVLQPTRGNSILDLVMSNEYILPTNLKLLEPLGSSDHSALEFQIKSGTRKTKKREVMLFKAVNWVMLRQRLRLNWAVILEPLKMQEAWTTFKQIVINVQSESIPVVTKRSRNLQPWWNNHLHTLIQNKRKSWSLFKTNMTTLNYQSYKTLRNQVTAVIRKSKKDFELSLISSKNREVFFKYLNKKKDSCSSKISLIKTENRTVVSEEDCAKELNNFFVSVFNPVSRSLQEENLINTDALVVGREFSSIKVEVEQVLIQLSRLKTKKTSGPDSILTVVLKNCKDELAPALTILFNKSLEECYLPQDWKDANILPIFKSGDEASCSNYRPISLTSVIIKLLEKIIYLHLYNYLEQNKLLDNEQFGFRQSKNCELQLLFYTYYIAQKLDKGKEVHSIYLDLQKAFDKVPHEQLLYKLKNQFAVTGNVLAWIRSFLCNRRQRVKIGKTYSDWAQVLSGVPQGSVLAPLLFIVYVKDLQEGLKNTYIVKFADDTKLYCEYNGPNSHKLIQSDLEVLSLWLRKWKMFANTSKTAALKFERMKHDFVPSYLLNGEIIKFSSLERDLGVQIDSKLNFKCHIQNVVNKCFRIYGWIVRTVVNRDSVVVLSLYKSLIRPNLEYASSVWNPLAVGQIQKLEKVQRKLTKYIIEKNTPYEKRLELLQLPSLRWRRLFLDLLRVYEILQMESAQRKQIFTLSSEISNTNLRRHRLTLHGEHCNTNVLKSHFANRVIDSWNALPNDLIEIPSYSLFKVKLKVYLMLKKSIYHVNFFFDTLRLIKSLAYK